MELLRLVEFRFESLSIVFEYTPYDLKIVTPILTDGRFYQLKTDSSAPTTLDIGFNFLTENREFTEFNQFN